MKKMLSLAVCLMLSGLFQSLFSYELAVISMFRNCAPYLKEWVEYHRMVGVDHFWLYNDESTDNWEEVLKPYIDEGLVEVYYWPAGKPWWVNEQLTAYADGVRRAMGNTTWVALMDQDEFLLPMMDKTVTECLKNHFSDASAIYISWRNFGTSGVTLAEGEPMLFRLTACSLRDHPRNWCGKSIFRPEVADLDQLWSPHFCALKLGFNYVDGDGNATLTAEGSDLKPQAKHHSKYIRINHYALRDENYYHNYRVPRDPEPWVISALYDAYNKDKDYIIIELIKNKHPEMYKKIWKK